MKIRKLKLEIKNMKIKKKNLGKYKRITRRNRK